jgi:hypothetical protein
MTERISGPLGTERGWSHVIEQRPYPCHLCGEQIPAGRMMMKDGARRHAGCHIRARHVSMSPSEQVELMQRIHDAAFGEHSEPADNDPDQVRNDGEADG